MVYDDDLERGVRKKYLNEPNPQKVELARNATLADVFQKAKQLYFSEIDVDVDSMCLADSAGILIPIQDKESWSLSSFYQKNRLQPSRYKLYVAVYEVSEFIPLPLLPFFPLPLHLPLLLFVSLLLFPLSFYLSLSLSSPSLSFSSPPHACTHNAYMEVLLCIFFCRLRTRMKQRTIKQRTRMRI